MPSGDNRFKEQIEKVVNRKLGHGNGGGHLKRVLISEKLLSVVTDLFIYFIYFLFDTFN